MDIALLSWLKSDQGQALSSFDTFIVTGKDRRRFLNGQLTNMIPEVGTGNIHCRLDKNGRLVGFLFFLIDLEENFYLLIPSRFSNELIEDLEKYIIMDDVEIKRSDEVFSMSGRPSEESLIFNLAGLPIFASKKPGVETRLFQEISIRQGLSVVESSDLGDLANHSVLEAHGICFSKGCFLGQETVAKIHSRRGAAKKTGLLRIENLEEVGAYVGKEIRCEGQPIGRCLDGVKEESSGLLVAKVKREFRVEGRKFSLEIDGFEGYGVFQNAPLYEFRGAFEISQEIFREAVKEFQNDQDDEALEMLQLALDYDPSNVDALESLGVIFGRQEKFLEGIEVMDELLKRDSSSVMAHTNKSLFYMRLGNIEKAEEEKAQATLKSFEKFGRESEEKELEEKRRESEEKDREKRRGMFLQVLRIDDKDVVANFGLADILFSESNFVQTLFHVDKALAEDPEHSVSYLLKGKCLEKLNRIEDAIDNYKVGIEISSRKGDLMPANEMQSRLNQLA